MLVDTSFLLLATLLRCAGDAAAVAVALEGWDGFKASFITSSIVQEDVLSPFIPLGVQYNSQSTSQITSAGEGESKSIGRSTVSSVWYGSQIRWVCLMQLVVLGV